MLFHAQVNKTPGAHVQILIDKPLRFHVCSLNALEIGKTQYAPLPILHVSIELKAHNSGGP